MLLDILNTDAPGAWRDDPKKETWDQWRTATHRIINDALWPDFDRQTRSFPHDRHDQMAALTEADFRIMKDLENARMMDELISSPNAGIPSRHARLFEDEMNGHVDNKQLYVRYDRSLSGEALASLDVSMDFGLVMLCHNIHRHLKNSLLRPRPYQMAPLFGVSIKNSRAPSGLTPSMVSGHAFQGCGMLASILDFWELKHFNVPETSIECVRQWGVDFGDRRVFAGVHYPSDNLASWILILRLAPRVCRSPKTTESLCKAISKSVVYQRIKSSGSDAYKVGLTALQVCGVVADNQPGPA